MDLVALRAEQTKLKPPPPGAQPLDVVLKGRKARKLIPPTPVDLRAASPTPTSPPMTPQPPPAVRGPNGAPPAPTPTVSPLPIAVAVPAAASPPRPPLPPTPLGRPVMAAAPAPTIAPRLEPTNSRVPPPPPLPWGQARPPAEPVPATARKHPVAAIAGATALVIVLAGASWVSFGRGKANPAATTAATSAPATSAPTTAAPTTTASTATSVPAVDPIAAWAAYRAPDGSFTVKLPSTPKVTTTMVTVLSVQLPQTEYDAGTALVITLHFPTPIPADQADSAFAGGVAGFKTSITKSGSTISNESTTTVLGRRASQGQVDTPGLPTAHYTIMLGTQDVIIILTVGDLATHQAALASLQLNLA